MMDITAAYLRSILDYNPETGEFRWELRGASLFESREYPRERECARWNARYAGTVAGYYDRSSGYRRINIDGRQYRAHRLAWLWMTGEWPKNQIDHINMNRSDNRWINLREATNAQNQANIGPKRFNTSGIKGVYWHKRLGKWHASISVDGRLKFLGYAPTKQGAAALYRDAAMRIHGEFARLA